MRHFRAERRKFRKTKTYIMLKIGFVAIMLSLFVTLSAVGSYFRPSSEFAGQNAAFNTAVFIILENGVKIYISFKTLYPRGKGPTYEPLLCPCLRTTCNFLLIFLGCCLTLKQRARMMVGLEHPTFRLRGGDVTTSPPLPRFKLKFSK